LEHGIRFINHNYEGYHEILKDATPYDAYVGQHLEILQRRKEAKRKTVETRLEYNRTIREQSSGL